MGYGVSSLPLSYLVFDLLMTRHKISVYQVLMYLFAYNSIVCIYMPLNDKLIVKISNKMMCKNSSRIDIRYHIDISLTKMWQQCYIRSETIMIKNIFSFVNQSKFNDFMLPLLKINEACCIKTGNTVLCMCWRYEIIKIGYL